MTTRRAFLQQACAAAAAGFSGAGRRNVTDFDVSSFGTVGDGIRLDTAAIQRTIDVAAASGKPARVLLRGGKRYLTGTLRLRGGIDFHLAEDATLVTSLDERDYDREDPAILSADGAAGLKIGGTGHIDGQAMKFMTTYSESDQRWEPKPFRPRMFSLKSCRDLEIKGIPFGASPNWGLHMLGCDGVLVDGVVIRNFMDVPNCDGIDPDRCRDVEIRNCDIVCADDGIVLKTSQQARDYGVMRNVAVKDCRITTRDSGIKIGTETFGDISRVRFERCQVISGGRGPTITHRQKGNISDVEFTNIEVVAEHHAARWWGWGEAVSITVWPRTADGVAGKLSDIRIRNLKARAENSVRIEGTKDNPVENVVLENLDVMIDRWTTFLGGKFDNRPTAPGVPGLVDHGTPVYSIRNAKDVRLIDCKASWGSNRQPYFTYALEAENVAGLDLVRFEGQAAYPGRYPAIKR